MEKFQTQSKIYITPDKKNHIFSITVNISIVLVMLISIVSLISDGIKIHSISAIVISIFVSFKLKDLLKLKPYYEFSIVNIGIEDEKILLNYDVGREVLIDISSIKSIEYSDKLGCIRFVGDYVMSESKNRMSYNCQEYLLYVKYEDNIQLFPYLEQNTKLEIVYVDR